VGVEVEGARSTVQELGDIERFAHQPGRRVLARVQQVVADLVGDDPTKDPADLVLVVGRRNERRSAPRGHKAFRPLNGNDGDGPGTAEAHDLTENMAVS
jgi:hypothetical protein